MGKKENKRKENKRKEDKRKENKSIVKSLCFWYILGFSLVLTKDIYNIIIGLIILLKCLDKTLEKINGTKLTIPTQYTLAEIDAMDGYEFEGYMKGVFENLGYSVHHTPLSGDQGADLILTSNEGIRTAVQVKRYSNNVSNSAVQEVVAAKGFHKCTKGIVVTNSYFTDSAIELAKANGINLVDRTGLTKLLNESFHPISKKQENFIDGLRTGFYNGLRGNK